MRVVRFGEERNETRALFRRLEEDESKRHDCGTTYIVVDVGNSDMQQTANRGVGPSAAVSHGHGVHTGPSEDGILEKKQDVYDTFSLLLM